MYADLRSDRPGPTTNVRLYNNMVFVQPSYQNVYVRAEGWTQAVNGLYVFQTLQITYSLEHSPRLYFYLCSYNFYASNNWGYNETFWFGGAAENNKGRFYCDSKDMLTLSCMWRHARTHTRTHSRMHSHPHPAFTQHARRATTHTLAHKAAHSNYTRCFLLTPSLFFVSFDPNCILFLIC